MKKLVINEWELTISLEER